MGELTLFWILQVLVFLAGIAVGHTFLKYKVRQQETRSRMLELKLMEKRQEVLQQGKIVAGNLEEVLFKAQVQSEIDDITRRGRKSA